MTSSITTLFGIIAAVLLGAVLLAMVLFLFTKLFGMTFLVLRNIFRFIGEQVTDTLRFVGAVLASILFAPLVVLSVVIGRWSASRHYAGALMNELRSALRCVYRIVIGNVARLFGVSKALEGVEQRVPNVMAGAPTHDKPSKRVGMFEGYKIVGSLKGGGSGGKLYIAEPDEVKQAIFAKRKLGEVDQVVIKVFSLKDGSSLPQIVRESRALDAARSLGLVLEHQMAPERFFYVMRYVPGESLSVVTQRLHSLSPNDGLGNDHLRSVMSYSEDLLVALDTYHNAELWHKDVKPDNIIVDGHGSDAKAHLVDFGLITPMRSAMTLTTHGTEYFRDPELVRQALRGVKVHQIDGSKFDIYGAGAVLFSMIENSFPAHGGLSQISRKCPEALRWIVRRAMTDYDRRYPSAAVMLADLRVVLNAQDPFVVKPIDLPSVSQGDVAAAQQVESQRVSVFDEPVSFGAGSPVPPQPIDQKIAGGQQRVGRPNVNVADWWSGRYAVHGGQRKHQGVSVPRGMGSLHKANANVQGHVGRVRPLRSASDRRSAKDQVRAARGRVKSRRMAAGKRVKSFQRRKSYSNTPGVAVVFAGALGLGVLLFGGALGAAMFTEVFYQKNPSSAIQPPVSPATPQTPSSNAQAMSISDGSAEYSENGVAVVLKDGTQTMMLNAQGQVDGDVMVKAELLVVPLLSSAFDPDAINAMQTHLRAQGVTIVGDDQEDEGFVIDLIAQMQNAVGALPIDSPELPTRIQQWLKSKSFDGVFVLGKDPAQPQARGVLVMDGIISQMAFSDDPTNELVATLTRNGYGID